MFRSSLLATAIVTGLAMGAQHAIAATVVSNYALWQHTQSFNPPSLVLVLVGGDGVVPDESRPLQLRPASEGGPLPDGTPVTIHWFNSDYPYGACTADVTRNNVLTRTFSETTLSAPLSLGIVQFELSGYNNAANQCPPAPHGNAMRGTLKVGSTTITDGIGNPLIVTIATADLDGSGGVAASDESLWLNAYFCQQNTGYYTASADYDGDGNLGSNDLSIFLNIFFASHGTACHK